MTSDTRTTQRLLNLAGYGPLVVDGIAGPLTRAAMAKWEADAAAALARYGELDARSERNLSSCLPSLQRVARQLLPKLQDALPTGYSVKIICGTRTFPEQAALYAQGRTAPGPRVTNAPAGSSYHNYGMAFDIGIFTPNGAYVETDRLYRDTVAVVPLPPGLDWGGSWKSLPDAPHFQLRHPHGATLSAIRALSESGSFPSSK